ncbi:MAG: uncharacterized protein QOF91_760 [Alphaproteobacteria bacterium]|nr:uncharacterized protein [Alphaproteobacteria bacterium]
MPPLFSDVGDSMPASDPRPPVPKPLPVPSPESAIFWQAARNHRMLLPHCNKCGKFWFPPSCLCPHCLSDDIGWREVSGRGRVHSFVIVHRVYHPAFISEVPYVVAVIELDEGPRLLSNVVNVKPARVHCGMRVAVTYDDVSAEISLPKFSHDDV